jgi:D-inositol-3-phosphate glycosyltransferase
MPNTKTPSLHVMTSTSSGGLELYVSTLIAEMARAGMPVSALVAKNARFINTLIEAGVDVHFAHSQNKLDLRDVLLIRSIVRSRQCGIIHSHTRFDVWRVSLALIGDRARKHVHSVYMVVVPKKDWLHRMIYGRVDAALSSSSYTNARIAECFNVAAEKIHLVRYGRYLGNYQRDEALRNSMRTEFGLDANALAFGMIGRTDVQKGVREFAESFSLLPAEVQKRVHYFIIGEPTVTKLDQSGRPVFEQQGVEVHEWITKYSNQTGIAGHLHILPFQKEIVPFYGMLDCLVLASYAEMYSLSVIDAMSMGLPVIGTDAEGTPEQVRDGVTGFLVSPKSASEIAIAVEKYVAAPTLLAEHGAAGRKWAAEEHDFGRTLSKINAIYKSLMNPRLSQVRD